MVADTSSTTAVASRYTGVASVSGGHREIGHDWVYYSVVRRVLVARSRRSWRVDVSTIFLLSRDGRAAYTEHTVVVRVRSNEYKYLLLSFDVTAAVPITAVVHLVRSVVLCCVAMFCVSCCVGDTAGAFL